jgi:dolichyl-phosphate-mannose-protein mannosyltransferase
MTPEGSRAERWTSRHIALLGAGMVLGAVVRILLLPTEGLRDDTDQFVSWVHHIATNGLGTLYEREVSFGPLMAYIWAGLAAIEPAFRLATDASDEGIRSLMKAPASLADFGLALLAAHALRSRPGWAVTAAVVLLLHPAVIYVSAWWGQYESIFAVWALAAVVCAVNARDGLSALFVALALLTKPQAAAFIIPFAAWYYARGGMGAVLRAGAIGLVVALVAWLPFLTAGGPAGYLRNLAMYQNDIFAILSLRAWNIWWILQEAAAGGLFIADNAAVVGPVTLRHVGYGVTALLELIVAVAIVRDPRPRTLILGLVASSLVIFSFMTQMHERYAYAALVLLVLLIPETRMRVAFIALSAVLTVNLVAAIPPSPSVAAVLPIDGPVGVIGSLAVLAVTASVMLVLMTRPRPTPMAVP